MCLRGGHLRLFSEMAPICDSDGAGELWILQGRILQGLKPQEEPRRKAVSQRHLRGSKPMTGSRNVTRVNGWDLSKQCPNGNVQKMWPAGWGLSSC